LVLEQEEHVAGEEVDEIAGWVGSMGVGKIVEVESRAGKAGCTSGSGWASRIGVGGILVVGNSVRSEVAW
jgi:hypothetical protein